MLKEEEVPGDWRKLHNEQLHDLYRSSNIVGVFRLRRIGRVWHVACVGEGRLACRVVVERGTILRVGDNIEMEFIGKEEMVWTGLMWLGTDKWQTVWNTVMKIGFHTSRVFVDWLRKYQLIRDKSAAWIWLVALLFSSFSVSYLPSIPNGNFID